MQPCSLASDFVVALPPSSSAASGWRGFARQRAVEKLESLLFAASRAEGAPPPA